MTLSTKKIPELDPYGSVTKPAYLRDLLEISKNDGTYGSPTYGAGTSRKITVEQFLDNMGCIPYSGDNYEVVKADGTDTENGTNLIVAYLACYAKTPNGSVLSANNRATVYFFSGRYNTGVSIINVGEFVDFIGIGTAESILIYGSTGNSIFFIEDDNDYSFENFSVQNVGVGKSLSHNFGATDNGKWDNVIFMTETNRDIIWNGKYNKIKGEVDSVMLGSLGSDCIVSNSNFQNKSCGYSETDSVDISGKIINCTGIDYCFGYSSFGSTSISGEIDNCTGRDYCFGVTIDDASTVDISGKIKNSNGRNTCFSATTSSMATTDISGLAYNCKANSTSFSYSGNTSNCSISGKVDECEMTGVSGFGGTTIDGTIKNCKGINSIGSHSGKIISCFFENTSGVTSDTLKINDGAIVNYCSILQRESTKDAIKIASGAEVKITHCETNKDFNIISGDSYTNIIAVPYNVIDSNL